jgi:hypothetical protein
MDTVACRDIGRSTKNPRGALLYLHQVEKPEFSFLVVDKQVNVGVFAGLAACRRAERIEALNTELHEFGLVRLQCGNGLIAFRVRRCSSVPAAMQQASFSCAYRLAGRSAQLFAGSWKGKHRWKRCCHWPRRLAPG